MNNLLEALTLTSVFVVVCLIVVVTTVAEDPEPSV